MHIIKSFYNILDKVFKSTARMKIDKALLEEYGLILMKLKMFPYFDIAHYILMCYHVREDIHQHQTGINSFLFCLT